MGKILSMIRLISILVLTGCKEQLPEYTLEVPTATEGKTETAETEATEPKEYREYATYPVERPKDNIVGNIYYYTDSRVISYYDTELRRRVTLCSQPNCTHNDEKCMAYLGGGDGTSYQVYGDVVYAIIDHTSSGGNLLFIARNLITGENRTLWDLTPEENTVREYVGFSICEDVAFLTFREFEMEWKEDGTSYLEKDIKHYSYEIDLITGERELLLVGEAPSLEGVFFSGDSIVVSLCTQNYLLISDVEYIGELPMTMEEYLKMNPGGDYAQYFIENDDLICTVDHYSIDRKTGERKRIYGNDTEARHQDFSCMRDRKVVFTQGNTVCVYDGYTGEVKPYFEEENIGYMGYLDGRIIYNTGAESMYSYFWYDLQTGEKKQFQEGINIMVFAVQEETRDYFYGYYNGKMCFISKQDFYNENYDAAF